MVSVIIPVYNVEKHIEETMRSVLNQTYKDFEVIIVDDGSEDKSVEYAKRVLDEFEFTNYRIIKGENSGSGVARDTGLDSARGEWVFFMDADDLLNWKTLEVLVNEAEAGQADMVFCGFRFVNIKYSKKNESHTDSNDTGKNIRIRTKTYTQEDLQYDFLLRKAKILAPGTIYRKSLLDENRIAFPKLRFSEDVYFLWELLGKIKKAVYVENELYLYVVRNHSVMTSSKPEHILESLSYFNGLNNLIQNNGGYIEPVKKWMLARWTLGVLRSSTKLMEWETYKKFAEKVNYKKICKDLREFPDIKVRLLVILMKNRLDYYYKFFSRR